MTPSSVPGPLASEEAEISVVGAALIDPLVFDRLEGILEEEDFFYARNRILYQEMQALAETGTVVDGTTLVHRLTERRLMERVGGRVYIAQVWDAVPSAANVEYHARIVHEQALRRRLLDATGELRSLVLSDKSIAEVLDLGEKMIMACNRDQAASGLEKVPSGAFVDIIAEKASGKRGAETGFIELDDMTMGFNDGDLVIIAGATSMGKTAFALQVAAHTADTRGPVGVVSMEMVREELIWRMLCAEGGVDGQRYRREAASYVEGGERLAAAAACLNRLPILIDDSSGLTLLQIRSRARRMAARHGIAMLVVDHLQIMGWEGETRNLALGEITSGLKALAKDLMIPVVLLSQLSRIKDRADKRPVLSDLRESGAIEQDANTVIFLHRPEYYLGPRDADGNDIRGRAEAIVAKQRNGATGKIQLFFREEFARFENRTWRQG